MAPRLTAASRSALAAGTSSCTDSSGEGVGFVLNLGVGQVHMRSLGGHWELSPPPPKLIVLRPIASHTKHSQEQSPTKASPGGLEPPAEHAVGDALRRRRLQAACPYGCETGPLN